jgi:hypothetical protein
MTEAKTPTGHIAYCIAAKRIQCSTFQKKVLWLYYAINTNNEGRFFKSYDTITAETGVSESTARRCNRDWEKLKLITTVEPALDSGKATEYQLHLPAMQALAAKFNMSETEQRLALIKKIQGRARQKKWRDAHPVAHKTLEEKLRQAIGK